MKTTLRGFWSEIGVIVAYILTSDRKFLDRRGHSGIM